MVVGLMIFIVLLLSDSQVLFAAESKARHGGTLTMSDFVQEPNIGYPPKMFRPPAMRQSGPALETLLRTDMTGKPVPWLATAVKEDPKAMTITLTIRKGVKFHDGTDFNAEAVKWNLDQQVAEKGLGTENIKSVEIIKTQRCESTLLPGTALLFPIWHSLRDS